MYGLPVCGPKVAGYPGFSMRNMGTAWCLLDMSRGMDIPPLWSCYWISVLVMVDVGRREVWSKVFGEHRNFWKVSSLIRPRSMAHDWIFVSKKQVSFCKCIYICTLYRFINISLHIIYILRCFDLFSLHRCLNGWCLNIEPLMQVHELGMVSKISHQSHVDTLSPSDTWGNDL